MKKLIIAVDFDGVIAEINEDGSLEPKNLVKDADVKSFSILCFHFEKRKRYMPTNIGCYTTHVVTDTSKK